MPSEPPKKILFVKLVEQGATVVAEPAIRRAIEMAEDAASDDAAPQAAGSGG